MSALASWVHETARDVEHLATFSERMEVGDRDAMERACQTFVTECVRVRAVEAALASQHPFPGLRVPEGQHIRWNVGAGGVGAFAVPCDCEQGVDHQVPGLFITIPKES